MRRWTCLMIWVVWAVNAGVMQFGEAVYRSGPHNPFGGGNPRHNEVLTGPTGTLVEALRQLLGVPSGDFPVSSDPYAPPPRPPRYMLDLYRRLSQGGSSLPRHANTVRSFKPQTDGIGNLLLYNVSAVAREQVLGAWLHLRGSSGRERAPPRLRPSRILVYLFPDVADKYTKPPAPIMMHTLSPHQQEIELTRGVREVIEEADPSRSNLGLLGIRVEELRRGRYVSRASEKLTRRPPLLFVYSSDPALLDLEALGVAALNISKIARPPPFSRSSHLKRYIRSAEENVSQNEEDSKRPKRSIGETDWMEAEIEEEQQVEEIEEQEEEEQEEEEGEEEMEAEELEEEEEDEVRPSRHRQHIAHHPLLTNELPSGDTSKHAPLLPKVFSTERGGGGGGGGGKDSASRRHRRRRRKHHRKRGKGEDDNLIPLPENYSKIKWGERERRRKNKRRRRNRKLPESWMAAAQNTLNNDANSVNFGADIQQGPLMSTRPCERHELDIDFKTVGWDDWIVAPAGFNAYYCAGVCPHPLPERMSGSNHAVVQSLINFLGLRPEVPAPCCVPDKLDALSVLFMDDEGRFILKNYPKMIVTSCSCQ